MIAERGWKLTVYLAGAAPITMNCPEFYKADAEDFCTRVNKHGFHHGLMWFPTHRISGIVLERLP
jgi:hypothetical protein